jgi:hypothetical protein
VLAKVAIELSHEALAKTHDLVVGFALGVEIGAALAATDRHAGQCVFEDLLEAEELDDAEVDRGMKAQAPLIGTQGTVEFDAEAPVDLDLALVVAPGDAKDNLAFRFTDALDNLVVSKLRVFDQDRAERFENFGGGLVKFSLTWVAGNNITID